MVDDVYQGNQPYLQSLAHEWERNIRFFMGDQYLFFDEVRRRYEVIPQTKYNKFIPRPVTNMILPIVQTMVSIWTRQKPNASVIRNSTDPADDNAAKLAERIQDAKWDIDDEVNNHIKAALVLCLAGTVIRKDYWDCTKGPDVNIPAPESSPPVIPAAPQPQAMPQDMQSQQQSPMPPDQAAQPGQEPQGPDLLAKLAQTVQGQATESLGYSGKAGDNAVDILDPFRIIKDLQTGAWIIEANVKPLAWIKAQYGKTGDGYTGRAAEVKEEDGLSAVMELHQRLKTSTSSGAFKSSSKETELKGCAVIKECYVEPTEKHPNGLMIVRAGGQTLFVGDSPYWNPRYPESWHPYSFAKYQELYFRWHGLPLVTNLIKLQERLNAIDALIALARKTTAVPQWLKPTGCGVVEGYITGQPGLEIPYNPVGANGAKPERLPGLPVSGDIWREREQVVQSMHQIPGDNEVLSGLHPEGVNTAASLNMLLEQSFSKFNPFIQGWEKFIENGQSNKMRLIQTKYKEPRPEFINRLKELNKDNLDVEISAFLGEDLRNNVNFRIEAGSSLPRSKVVEQETLKDLAKGGMFGPLDPGSNPIGNQEFLEKFGMTPFNTELDADVKRARWVVGVLHQVSRGEMGQEKIPPILEYDNKQVHLKILTDRMKQPSFKDDMGIFENRRMLLQQAIQQEQQAQMQQQMMAQQQALASQTPQVGNFPPPVLGSERPSVSGPRGGPQGRPQVPMQ